MRKEELKTQQGLSFKQSLKSGYEMSKNMGFLTLGLTAMAVAMTDLKNPLEVKELFEQMGPPISGLLAASIVGMGSFKSISKMFDLKEKFDTYCQNYTHKKLKM